MDTTSQNKTYEYFAFISYKREDEKWAKWLQKKLESYSLPTAIRKENPELPNKIRPVFRDQSELSGGNLKAEIEKSLNNSKYLIVICSPRSAKSPWVSKEVQYFIDQGREKYIIPFIIGGIPNAANPKDECFPDGLRHLTGEKEILGININEMGREAAVIKVIARMFNLRFDSLWQRAQRIQRKKRIISWIVIICIVLFLSVITGIIYRQNTVIKSEMSRSIAAEIDRNLDKFNYSEALDTAYAAIAKGYTSAYEWEQSARRLCNNPFLVQKSCVPQLESPLILSAYSLWNDTLLVSVSGPNIYFFAHNKFTIINSLSDLQLFLNDVNISTKKIIGKEKVSGEIVLLSLCDYSILKKLPEYSSLYFLGDSLFMAEKRDSQSDIIELMILKTSSNPICSLRLPKNYGVLTTTRLLKEANNNSFYLRNKNKILRVTYNEYKRSIDTLSIVPQIVERVYGVSNDGKILAFSSRNVMYFGHFRNHSDSIVLNDSIIDLRFSTNGNFLDILTKTQIVRFDMFKKKVLLGQNVAYSDNRRIVTSDSAKIVVSNVNAVETYMINSLYNKIKMVRDIPSNYKFLSCSKFHTIAAFEDMSNNSIVFFDYKRGIEIFKEKVPAFDNIKVKFLTKKKIAIIRDDELTLYSFDKSIKNILSKKMPTAIIDCIATRKTSIVATKDSLYKLSISENRILNQIYRPDIDCLDQLVYDSVLYPVVISNGYIYSISGSLKECPLYNQSKLKVFDFSKNEFLAKTENDFMTNSTIIGNLKSNWALSLSDIPDVGDNFYFINDGIVVGLHANGNIISFYDKQKRQIREFNLGELFQIERVLYLENEDLWLYDNTGKIFSVNFPNTKSIISEISGVMNDRK